MTLSSKTFIGIGSNKGDRKKNCETAIKALASFKNSRLIKESSFYETEAWGDENQDNFINCVVEIKTEKNIFDFFSLLQKTEKNIGKEKERFWGPRKIDIDLLFFGTQIINEPELKVPHPLLHLRRFVLEPLTEIAPDFIHPAINQPLQLLFNKLADPKKTVKILC